MNPAPHAAPAHGMAGIADLTRRISELAEQGDWAGAAALNADRQAQLEAFCASLTPGDTAADTLDTLTRILELNDALIASVQRRQQCLLQQALSLSTGRKAVAAYGP